MRKHHVTAAHVLIILALILFCITCLYPFWNMYVYAFNEGKDAMKGNLYFWPRKFTLENIQSALQYRRVSNGFKISILRTVIGTVTHILVTSLMAYAMGKRQIPGHKFFSTYFFIPFLFSGGLIPGYILLQELHLLNTFWVYIVPGLFSYWDMIIFRSYFDSLPQGLEESAQIDGAGVFTIFFKVVFPISKPVFAAESLFCAVGHWNDWFSGAFYVKNPNLWPLQTILQQMINSEQSIAAIAQMSGTGSVLKDSMNQVTLDSMKKATFVITVTPIILIYPFLQKYFVKGIMVGAIKG